MEDKTYRYSLRCYMPILPVTKYTWVEHQQLFEPIVEYTKDEIIADLMAKVDDLRLFALEAGHTPQDVHACIDGTSESKRSAYLKNRVQDIFYQDLSIFE